MLAVGFVADPGELALKVFVFGVVVDGVDDLGNLHNGLSARQLGQRELLDLTVIPWNE